MLLESLSPIGRARTRLEVLLLIGGRGGYLEVLKVGGPCRSLILRSEATRRLEGLRSVVIQNRSIEGRLESLEVGIKLGGVCVLRAEALSRVVARREAVLLKSAVDVGLLLELLQGVGRPAHCVRHGGGRGEVYSRIEVAMHKEGESEGPT